MCISFYIFSTLYIIKWLAEEGSLSNCSSQCMYDAENTFENVASKMLEVDF